MAPELAPLKKLLLEIAHLDSAIALLGWDQETHMPSGGAEARAATIASLSAARHTLATSAELQAEVGKAQAIVGLSEEEQALVREVAHDLALATKLPTSFVAEMAEVCSRGQVTWAAARANNRFSDFAPVLTEIVGRKRQEAVLRGYSDSPYDALLATYEPGATAAGIGELFAELKTSLVAILSSIPKNEVPVISGSFPADKQLALSRDIATALGYRFDRGDLTQSAHPFSTSFHPTDSRITTHCHEDCLTPAIGATIHETGHALYEQGLPVEWFATPLGQAASVGVHESQSRSWENMVGRSAGFWQYMYPTVQQYFPELTASAEEFRAAFNQVRPSLIRIEADEVTYNLHIIIRFELERALIEGALEVADLPAAWNAKVKEYLGIDVPDDAHGVLQDVHWSCGYFGYFPTYALGNLYAAQMWEVIQRDLPDLEDGFAQGEFAPLLAWFREHVHQHGRRFAPNELIERATGKTLGVEALATYLRQRYVISK